MHRGHVIVVDAELLMFISNGREWSKGNSGLDPLDPASLYDARRLVIGPGRIAAHPDFGLLFEGEWAITKKKRDLSGVGMLLFDGGAERVGAAAVI